MGYEKKKWKKCQKLKRRGTSNTEELACFSQPVLNDF